MKEGNCKINRFFWGLALATSVFFAACGKDSSSEADRGGNSKPKAAWAYLKPSVSYGQMTDARDGQVYKTVVIGTQTWMAENLNYKVDSSWCYGNTEDSCAKYGRLYQWTAAMGLDPKYNRIRWGESDANHQGICPSGWHMPNDADWAVLVNFAGGKDGAGAKLRSTGGWYEIKNDKDGALVPGSDAYGFSALPAGYRYDVNGGDFSDAGYYAGFWSAMEDDESITNPKDLFCDDAIMYTSKSSKSSAFSVRCVKD